MVMPYLRIRTGRLALSEKEGQTGAASFRRLNGVKKKLRQRQVHPVVAALQNADAGSEAA
jgi:hypothetical protein